MKLEEYETTINNERVVFYLNKKTHRYEIFTDTEVTTFSKAKGDAIIQFLKWLESIN